MNKIAIFFERYIGELYIPRMIYWEDIVEIAILSVLVYHMIIWIKRTKAWILLKGVLVIFAFIVIAAVFQMSTIMWIVENVLSIVVIAMIVILQPELRRALEQLGQKNIKSPFNLFDSHKVREEKFSDRTVNELVNACGEMSKAKTGALIVIERNVELREYETTGIEIGAIVSSQLLINIFEHNTPLHDGAIILNGDKITYATCYLPLSANQSLSKELGTRHRAGVGVSEVTDSFTIVVSEETGAISTIIDGNIKRHITTQQLREELIAIQGKSVEIKKRSKKKAIKNARIEGEEDK